jgi:hypothetical protein
MFRLTLDAIQHLESLVSEEHLECDFDRCGAVSLAAKPSHLRALEARGRFLRQRLGY